MSFPKHIIGVILAFLLQSLVSSQQNTNEDFRLPNNVVPVQHCLELCTNLVEDDFRFWGFSTIKITVTEATNQIILHSRNLTITESEVYVSFYEGETVRYMTISSIDYNDDYDFMIICIQENLVIDTEYFVYIPFNATLQDTGDGYKRISYTDDSGNSFWVSVTDFGSGMARSAFPCFDEVQMKIVFSVSLCHHESFTAISNTDIIQTNSINGMDGWVMDVFEDTPNLSTYQLVIVLSQFTSYKIPNMETAVNIWARSESILNQLRIVEDTVTKVLPFYGKNFGFQYPLAKLDVVVIPNFQCGQQGLGAVVMDESCVIYYEDSDTEYKPANIAAEVSERLASLWFGDLVSAWWSDVFLTNGLAFSFGEEGVSVYLNSEKYQDVRFISWYRSEMNDDSIVNYSQALVEPIESAKNLVQNLTSVLTNKSLMFFRMLRMILGYEAFLNGIVNYVQTYQYSVATVQNFLDQLNNARRDSGIIPGDIDLNVEMYRFIYNKGYPVVFVELDYSEQVAYLSQKRFVSDLTLSEEDRAQLEAETFTIPLSWVTSKDLNFDNYMVQDWLPYDCNQKTITLNDFTEDDFIIFNVQLYGLYRVNYSETNWNNIANFLLDANQFKQINAMNRMQILSDSFETAWTGDTSYEIPFKIAQYLAYETEEHVISGGLISMADIHEVLHGSDIFDKFNQFVCLFLEPMFDRYNNDLTTIPEDNFEARVKDTIIFYACFYGSKKCLDESTKVLMEWYQTQDPDSNNNIPPSARDNIYCFGIKNGDADLWNWMFERTAGAISEDEKLRILDGLGCTLDESIVTKYLLMSLDPSQIDPKYFWTVYDSLACRRPPLSMALIINFISQNYDSIVNVLKDASYVCDLLSKAGSFVHSKQDLEEFQSSLSSTLQENCKDVIDTVILNAHDSFAWYDMHYSEISGLLENYVG